jgi:hypothetical protein
MADKGGGITRICEGKMSFTSNGVTDLHATAGNFTTSSSSTNNTHGGDGGVVFQDYEPLHPDNTLDTSVDLTLNLYFDGTNNNKFNVKAREDKNANYKKHAFTWLSGKSEEDSSYDNGYTNIVHGYESTLKTGSKQAVVYIDGIGTRNEGADEGVFGKGLATGNTGYNVKVQKGCEDAAKAVSDKLKPFKGKTFNVLTVNLFGFSRGAATARYFLHLATKPANIVGKKIASPSKDLIKIDKTEDIFNKHGYFGYCLFEKGAAPLKIIFNFVGLYDTVSSFGADHRDDVTELGLNSISKANMIFQIAADDEFRENFDLTNIRSAGLKGLEITFPGVHSDIGGSYRNYTKELGPEIRRHYTTHFRKSYSNPKETPSHKKALAIKKTLIDEGWYTDEQLKIVETLNYEDSYKLTLMGSRELYNTYDKISLARMMDMSKDSKILLDDAVVKKLTAINDSFIKNIDNQLKIYCKKCTDLRNNYISQATNDKAAVGKITTQYLDELTKVSHKSYVGVDSLKKLRNKYLHWSVNNDKTGLGPRTNMIGIAPDLKKQELRKREIQNG